MQIYKADILLIIEICLHLQMLVKAHGSELQNEKISVKPGCVASVTEWLMNHMYQIWKVHGLQTYSLMITSLWNWLLSYECQFVDTNIANIQM